MGYFANEEGTPPVNHRAAFIGMVICAALIVVVLVIAAVWA